MPDWGGYREYVPVAERRKKAAAEVGRRARKGERIEPVAIAGRKIATTFWGKAWCDNLERYGDYANRLPRGRTYVRNGSVVNLQITAGRVDATVSGSSLYTVVIMVDRVEEARWKALSAECSSGLASLVELLAGQLSSGVMERLCARGTGLFPLPKELQFRCSCPDYASMCKHVAATLYGVGARLDQRPELLFELRHVDASDLIAKASTAAVLDRAEGSARVIADDDLGAIFGIDLDG